MCQCRSTLEVRRHLERSWGTSPTDHVKQAWEKVKVDLFSGEDEVYDDGNPNMEVTEEEGEKNVNDDDFDMERLQAEKMNME